jgi:hypothetical protein
MVNPVRRHFLFLPAGLLAIFVFSLAFAYPSIYPTGTTIFDPGRTWSGYTVFGIDDQAAVLVDMNGNEVQRWEGLKNAHPVRILPGGYAVGGNYRRRPFLENLALLQLTPRTERPCPSDGSTMTGNARVVRSATMRRVRNP